MAARESLRGRQLLEQSLSLSKPAPLQAMCTSLSVKIGHGERLEGAAGGIADYACSPHDEGRFGPVSGVKAPQQARIRNRLDPEAFAGAGKTADEDDP